VEDGLLGLRGDGALGLLGQLEDRDELEEEALEQGGRQRVCGHRQARSCCLFVRRPLSAMLFFWRSKPFEQSNSSIDADS